MSNEIFCHRGSTSFGKYGLLESFPDTIKWNALHDRVKESLDQNPFCILRGDSPAFKVKLRFLLELSDRSAVCTAHIIG
jgi:hypothetical protein